MPSGKCYARLYLFEGSGRQHGRAITPVPVRYGDIGRAAQLPLYLKSHSNLRLRFHLPVDLEKKATAGIYGVLVFGDDKEATAKLVLAVSSSGNIRSREWREFNFPEKKLCQKDTRSRESNRERLTEIKCQTGLSDYPYFTLFARLPAGVNTGKDAGGVLCLSLLANQIDDVRLSLINRDARGDIGDMIRYADNKKLIVLCWAIRSSGDYRSWDRMPPREAQAYRERFDRIVLAWERGVRQLANRYEFEPKNFLIWGYSSSAQIAARLAQRRPSYFGAVHLHNPSSLEAPEESGKHIIWGLTVGERDAVYEEAAQFVVKGHALGHRIIFKGVPEMGHDNDLGSRQLATLIFEYVRSLPEEERERARTISVEVDSAIYCGDWLNQRVETRDSKFDRIPPNLRVPLMNDVIKQAWMREKPLSPQDDPSIIQR
jgi:pimeloyl-ACP methyl ester carboxylesterase